MTTEQKMLALMYSFPALEKDMDVEGWDPVALDRWACGPAATSGSRYAAQFVLAVWSGRAIHLKGSPHVKGNARWECPWACGGFDVMEALKVWDLEHRDAFLAFVRDPWWV